MTEELTAAAVASLLRPGMKVFLQGAVGLPTAITDVLAAQPDASAGVDYAAVLVPSVNDINPAAWHETACLTTYFVYGDIAKSEAAGKVRFLPLHYSGITESLIEFGPYDLAVIQVSPPDESGLCSLGISVDFSSSIVPHAKKIVAQINPQYPDVLGSDKIPFEKLDYVVHADRALPELNTGSIPETLDAIAANVAGLIDDGDCLQVGIGKLPGAILSRLHDKKNLGLQGGMITDEGMALVEAGVMNGAAKNYDGDRHVCGIAVGSRTLYDWVKDRSDVIFRPATYTHDTRIVSRVDNFVSINSVLEVDLFCQANAEMINGQQVSGTGGLVDFVRSARMSRGGRSVLALSSTAAKGKMSRIVSKLGPGAIGSGLRADLDYVVTEHGAARLKDKSIDERATALIEIADPAFRDELSNDWDRLRGRS